MDKLVDANTVCDTLGLSKETLDELVLSGAIPRGFVFQIGNFKKYDLQSILKLGYGEDIPMDLQSDLLKILLTRIYRAEAIIGLVKALFSNFSLLGPDIRHPMQELSGDVKKCRTTVSVVKDLMEQLYQQVKLNGSSNLSIAFWNAQMKISEMSSVFEVLDREFQFFFKNDKMIFAVLGRINTDLFLSERIADIDEFLAKGEVTEQLNDYIQWSATDTDLVRAHRYWEKNGR